MTVNAERVHIRRAAPTDAEACYVAHRESTLVAYAHIFPRDRYPFPDDSMKERWRRECTDRNVLVAELDGHTIGTAGFNGSELVSFFVLPAYWGSGTADKLHDVILEVMGQATVRPFFLWTLQENHRARRFYEKRGWELTGRSTRSEFPPHPELVQYQLASTDVVA